MNLAEIFDTLDELRIDNKHGWGSVPDNQNVDYKGLRVQIKPSMFLRLAHELETPFSAGDIEKHISNDGAIGAPFLVIAIPQDWFEGDLTLPAEIYGHEGRNRMTAILRVEGDIPVETHLFFGGGVRKRNLTPEIVDRLNKSVISQRGIVVNGPWFTVGGKISEARKPILSYIKSLLPTWPDYVIKDWIYRPYSKALPDSRDSRDDWALMKDSILDMISNEGLSPTTKWTLVPNMRFSMDMWNDWTKDKLAKRWGGKSHPELGVTKDAERHATQAALAAQQGGVRDEPVILKKVGNRYELIEGWHRTIQHFKQFPDGYVGPAWVAVSSNVSEVAKVRISKDPNDLGAYVDDEGEPEPTVGLKSSNITSVLEPDEYHAEKPGAASRIADMVKDLESGKKLPPILVRKHGNGYQVLDGHHRFKAYKQAGVEIIPARIVAPENITGDIDESYTNKQREADDAASFIRQMSPSRANKVKPALEFALDSRSVYGNTPHLNKALDDHKKQILEWQDWVLDNGNIKDTVDAYLMVARLVSWPEVRSWWDDHKDAVIRKLLSLFKLKYTDLVFENVKLLERRIGLKWPELETIKKSCLSEIYNRAKLHESKLTDDEDARYNDDEEVAESWSNKYKKSIDCSHPKGFSQKAHCAARRKRAKGGKTKSKPVHEAAFDMKRYADQARSSIAVGWLDNVLQNMTYGVKVGKVTAAQPIKDLLDENKGAIITYLLKLIKRQQHNYKKDYVENVVSMLRTLEMDWPELAVIEKSLAAGIKENFADGKGPGRPGDSRRHGIPKHATLAQLDKIGKGKGRKAQLARWQANMRRGRKKTNENVMQRVNLGQFFKDLRNGYYESALHVLAFSGHLRNAYAEIKPALDAHKDGILRHMLVYMADMDNTHEDVSYYLENVIDGLTAAGVDWPELQIIMNGLIANDLSNEVDETIAPHGDPHNELEMLKAGTKPAALVNPWDFDKLYRPIIDGMGWEMIEYEIKGFEGQKFYVIAQPGEKARAQRIVQLVQDANKTVHAGGALGPEYHRELGFLLGYKKADIDHFLRNLYGDEHVAKVAEGDVILNKLANKQSQKNRTPYRHNQDIANSIPLYDPSGRHGVYHKAKADAQDVEVPFQRFEVAVKNDNVATIIGIAPNGKRIMISTAHPTLAHALADAYNRGGFTDQEIEKINLGEDQRKLGAALTVFDIDETLFHTEAKILVVKDGQVVRELDNREFNTYLLKDGESFDFKQFTDAQFFHDTSVPIETMWKRAKNTLDSVGRRPGSRVIIVTARSDFDDKEMFLNTFRKHGLDIDKIHVHRAGNLNMPSAAAKKRIIGQYLETGQFDMVRLFDDAESNLRSFLSLREDYPAIKFKAYMVLDDGSVQEYKV